MAECVFKYICIKGFYYLWDIRVSKLDDQEKYWVSGTLKAF